MKNMKLYFSVNRYNGTEKIREQIFPLKTNCSSQDLSVVKLKTDTKSGEISVSFKVISSSLKNASVGLIFEAENWSLSNYVFAPAALYNGNRFRNSECGYAPFYSKEELACGEPVITDVPRLSKNGDSIVQLSSGDMAVPCAGFLRQNSKTGFLLFWNQKNRFGDFGLTVKEYPDKKTADFIITSPCVREKTKYGMCTTKEKSDDKPADFKLGDIITFNLKTYSFDCKSETEFLRKFFDCRTEVNNPRILKNTVPWSYAFSLLEDKYNNRNWLENPGFYKSSEADSGIYRQWQTGWVGGAMNTLPGLILGNTESIEKSKRTLDFVFNILQHKSGFLYGIYCDDRVYGDAFSSAENGNIVMSRKNADALYFLAKQIMYLKSNGQDCKQLWENGTKRLADAFLNYYKINGELDQFIDIESLTPLACGTASAAITPAGLVLCSAIYNDYEYLSAASEIAENYYNNYLKNGFTNGGPGEILACPDSESAFGLLESFVCLFEHTNDKKWLNYAEDAAALCSSWCVSYSYSYKKNTQLYHRRASTVGAVWASVQNKHAAPGICTLSGSSLLRLYRATGNIKYLELCRDISHNITQFISTPEAPVYASYIWGGNADIQKFFNTIYVKLLIKRLKHKKGYGTNPNFKLPVAINNFGRIGERVNLSDWEGKENVGEIPGGSCWCEVSTMLTYLEIPSVYVNTDTGLCFSSDHLDCRLIKGKDDNYLLALNNPTPYDAQYRILVENSESLKTPLHDLYMTKLQQIDVKSHSEVTVKI